MPSKVRESDARRLDRARRAGGRCGGDVYVADQAHEVIDKFSAAGAYISQIKDPHLTGEMRSVALDAEGSLYVWENSRQRRRVVKFSPSGAFAAVFAEQKKKAKARASLLIRKPATYTSISEENGRGTLSWSSKRRARCWT